MAMSLQKLRRDWENSKPKKYSSELIDSVFSLFLNGQTNDNITAQELISSEFLAKYGWYYFHRDVPENHVLLIVYLLTFSTDHVAILNQLIQDTSKFHGLFNRVLSIFNNTFNPDAQLVKFIIVLMQNIKIRSIKKELSPLFSILIWENYTYKEKLLQQNDSLKETFEKQLKSYKESQGDVKEDLYLTKNWFYKFVTNTMVSKSSESLDLKLTLITDIISYLPTRRFTNPLLKELSFIVPFKDIISTDRFEFLQYLIYYPIDDTTGYATSYEMVRSSFDKKFSELQNVSFSQFNLEEFIVYPNINDFSQNDKLLAEYFSKLNLDQLKKLSNGLQLNLDYPNGFEVDAKFIINALWFKYCDHLKMYDLDEDILPDHRSLSNELNDNTSTIYTTIGYLSVNDYLWRTAKELKQRINSQLKELLDNIIKRMKVQKSDDETIVFKGSSKFCIPLTHKLTIHETQQSFFTSDSSKLTCEAILDFKGMSHDTQDEWDKLLAEGSNVYLLHLTESIETLVPARLIKVAATTKNRSYRYLVKIEGKYKDINFSSVNFLLKTNTDIQNDIKICEEVLQLSKSPDFALPPWMLDLFLRFGSPLESIYYNLLDKPLHLKLGSVVKEYQTLPNLFNVTVTEELTKKRKLKDESFTSSGLSYPFSVELAPGKEEISSVSSYTPLQDTLSDHKIKYTLPQLRAIIQGCSPGLTLIDGPINSGKSAVISQIIDSISDNFKAERTLLITKSKKSQQRILRSVSVENVWTVERSTDLKKEYFDLLTEVEELASNLEIEGAYGNDYKSAKMLYSSHINKKWTDFSSKLKEIGLTNENLREFYPFKDDKFVINNDLSFANNLRNTVCHYTSILDKIRKIGKLEKYQLFKAKRNISNINLKRDSKLISLTIEEVLSNKHDFDGLIFDNLIIFDACHISQLCSLLSLSINKHSNNIKRLIVSGNSLISDRDSIFTQLLKSGVRPNSFNVQFETRVELSQSAEQLENQQLLANPGLRNVCQFINVRGEGEVEKQQPGFYQNIEEAEYSVFLYMYLKLLHYKNSEIVIVTAYKSQQLLIKEILKVRCSSMSNIFGTDTPKVLLPNELNSDKFNYVILSLVKTKNTGIWENSLNFQNVLQSCLKGLYVFGEPLTYKTSCIGSLLLKNGQNDKLQLVTGEMYDNPNFCRKSTDNVKTVYDMENLQHMSNYVYQMLETLQNASSDK